MDFHLDEARVARAMLARAERAVVVADHAKFGARAPVSVCPLAAVARIVTDAPPSGALAALLDAAGVAISVADPP
jgi:DeoR family glycerol-3-phosphate regulon repressor